MQFAFGKLKSLSFIVVAALLTCSLVSTAVAKDKPAEALDFRGVIDDLDGYVNLRKEPRLNAPVIAKVSANEPFSFARAEAAKWCKVKLRSGITGWMHYSRIKLFFTNGDLPTKAEKNDEADEQARKQGLDYYQVSRAAARGDKAALDKFFRLDFDGAAAEEHVNVAAV